MSKNNIDQFDYTNCLFEARLTKKGFLGLQKLYYMYCTQDQIVICQEPYQKKPDKIILLQPNWQIQWIIDPKKQNQKFSEKTIGFRLITKNQNEKIEYYSDSAVMVFMRQYLAKQIFQNNFLDEYEIVKKIGKGKYAKVYKVKRKDNNKIYAVKYLHKKKLETIEDSQESLYNELKILRMINHPNCIKLIATYEDEHGFYILMELCESNKTLQGELTRFKNTQFGYQVVRHILKQLLKGIEYLHSIGIMHRDLKPQNIMFANDNSSSLNDLKIIDFGLSQFYNDPHYIYIHVGTPGFVAPEILSNESDQHRYTEKCDLFSIGVIFHILKNSISRVQIFLSFRRQQKMQNIIKRLIV
ncbi:protein kinase domain protein [Ichthyophthirius multifiliis]|uniref:non-specific serine/threonine protein kinase n=1 Tax=Ichthyophthirius multifiliis TaxID=5932 RepID=G0R3A6_ICHMU|nr:protein kinase domain protein [Ichthyophthirius multifiliis]EGR28049.1 protein kinase domain protein [Ichthyophthirius multifiliis]|eukprot:XP_004027394.1 protein kinase domain protein [Ichthyophthirius multifiliis]